MTFLAPSLSAAFRYRPAGAGFRLQDSVSCVSYRRIGSAREARA